MSLRTNRPSDPYARKCMQGKMGGSASGGTVKGIKIQKMGGTGYRPVRKFNRRGSLWLAHLTDPL